MKVACLEFSFRCDKPMASGSLHLKMELDSEERGRSTVKLGDSAATGRKLPS